MLVNIHLQKYNRYKFLESYIFILHLHCYSINSFPKICNGYTFEKLLVYVYHRCLFYIFKS